jgi:hypothetical protein
LLGASFGVDTVALASAARPDVQGLVEIWARVYLAWVFRTLVASSPNSRYRALASIIAIDPAVTANEESDDTGIVVIGLGVVRRGLRPRCCRRFHLGTDVSGNTYNLYPSLLVQSLYNEDELPRATATVQEFVTERGRQNITVTPLVEPIQPSTVKITFRVEKKVP